MQRRVSLATTQITTASISFIASLVVAVSLLVGGAGGLRNGPYKRIIFAISVADMMQSLSLIVGPFAPPTSSSRFAPWAMGNQATCTFAGFLFSFGGCLFMMNTALLSFYYLCKIKRSMSDETFNTKYEWKINSFIIIISLAVNLAGVGLRTINTGLNGTQCLNGAAFPTGCRLIPGLECEEPLSIHAAEISTVIFAFICASFLGILASMGSMVWHVLVRNEIFKTMSGTPRTSSQDTPNTEIQADNLRRLYFKEITTQALLYAGAFFLCYGPFAIASVLFNFGVSMSSTVQSIFGFTFAIFYPLNGLFTILIYTRPEVGNLKRSHPDYSWLRALAMVLKPGGEVAQQVPEDVNSSMPQLNESQFMSLPFEMGGMISSGIEFHGSEIDKNSVRFVSKHRWSHLEGDDSPMEVVSEFPSKVSFSQVRSSGISTLSDGFSLNETKVTSGTAAKVSSRTVTSGISPLSEEHSMKESSAGLSMTGSFDDAGKISLEEDSMKHTSTELSSASHNV